MKVYFGNWYPVSAMLAIDLALAITNLLLKKILSDGINLLVFITYHQSVSALFLSTIVFYVERKTRPKLKFTILCSLFVSAIIGASVTQFLFLLGFLLGLQYTAATFSCAFLNMVPVVTFLMALPFGLEKADVKNSSSGRAKVLGALVCVGGAILLTVYKGMPLLHFNGSLRVEKHDSNVAGVEGWAIWSAALVVGTVCWSSWYLLQSSIGKRYPCPYSSTAMMACFYAVQSAILSLSIEREISIWILKRKSDILIILYADYASWGCLGVSRNEGPVFTAAFSPLVMIMAAIFEVPVLHEQLYLGSVIGSTIVIAGLYVLLWGKDKETQNQDTKTDEKKQQEPDQLDKVVKISVESESRL